MQISRLEKRGYPLLRKIVLSILLMIITTILITGISKLIKETNEEEEKSTYDIAISNISLAINNYITEEMLYNNEMIEVTIDELINKDLLDEDGCYKREDKLKITKNSNDYLLNIEITCEDHEYTILEIGEYQYCENTLCVKKAIEIKD